MPTTLISLPIATPPEVWEDFGNALHIGDNLILVETHRKGIDGEDDAYAILNNADAFGLFGRILD